MPEINSVVRTNPSETRITVTLAEIQETTRRFIERNMSFTPAEFAALFGKKVEWALERMRDGSVTVLDEHAKVSLEGVRFSKFARIDALSVEEYRSTLKVNVTG